MRRVLLVVAANLVLLELCSLMLVHALGVVKPERRLDLRLREHFAGIDEAYWRRAAAGRDPELGWDSQPNRTSVLENRAGEQWTLRTDPRGARHDGADARPFKLATYGDSYVRCDEVEDDETWQAFLQQRIDADVVNYGVGGFGIAQTWLKLRRDLSRGEIADVTLFSFYEDGLDRAVNGFRPFLFKRTGGMLGFKPSYRVRNAEVVLLPNPWLDASWSLERLEQAAREAAADDFWVSHERLVVAEFPYLLQTFRLGQHVAGRVSRKLSGGAERPSLWRTDEGHRILHHVLGEFVETTREKGSVPVLLFIPAVRHWSEGRRAPAYRDFRKGLDGELDGLLVLDVDEADFEPERFNVVPYAGHASPYGNRAIADYLARRLREAGVVEALAP